MDQRTAKDVASVLRYSQQRNQQTVSTHEPEMLLKVVDGPDNHHTLPRRRDHSGACQIEIDVLQHHHPECEQSKKQNIQDMPYEDIQGSYVILERLPVATCENKNLLETRITKSTTPVPNPVSKFSVHDEHAILRGSRKGMKLNEPEAFDSGPDTTRSTIENVALLPKLGCSQPSFVARVEQKVGTKNRYDHCADPAAPRKSTPTVVNTASTTNKQTAFSHADKSPPKSNTKITPVYTTNTNDTNNAFDRQPSRHKPPVNSHSTKGLYHTCVSPPDNSLVYKDKDGKRLPSGAAPFDTPGKKQSVYSVVSKTSRVSFSEKNPPASTSDKRKQSTTSDRGVESLKNFHDPCFAGHSGPTVMVTNVHGPIFPSKPKPPVLSKTQCCPPDCDVQVIGKPKENFKEESGSEDDLIGESRHTVTTNASSRAETDVSENPYYAQSSRQLQPSSEGCFKRVFLCGACRKQSEPSHPPTVSRNTGTVPSSGTQRPLSATTNKSNISQSPSSQTGKSAVSHSKKGHNAEISYGSASTKKSSSP